MTAHGIPLKYFHGQRHPRRPGSIGAGELASLIEQLRPINADEWLNRSLADKLQPIDICLTLDGNLSCQRDIALPVLQDLRLGAFWFVSTGPLQGNYEHLEIDRLFQTICFNTPREFYSVFSKTLEESDHWPLAATLLEERCFALTDPRERHEFIRNEILGPAQYHELMHAVFADAGFDARAMANDLWMTDNDIRAVHGAGHVIGLHSQTAPSKLANLCEDAQREEYFENYAYLHNLLDTRPLTMSHPEASYNEVTLEILRELGIRVGFAASAGASELEYARVAAPYQARVGNPSYASAA